MSLLTKAAILAADDLPTADVAVPEWGGTVRIRAMTAGQREELEAELIHARNDGMVAPSNWRARHVAMFIVDEAGEPMFTENEAAQLGKKSGTAMNRVFDAINELNRGTAEAITDAAGNS